MNNQEKKQGTNSKNEAKKIKISLQWSIAAKNIFNFECVSVPLSFSTSVHKPDHLISKLKVILFYNEYDDSFKFFELWTLLI